MACLHLPPICEKRFAAVLLLILLCQHLIVRNRCPGDHVESMELPMGQGFHQSWSRFSYSTHVKCHFISFSRCFFSLFFIQSNCIDCWNCPLKRTLYLQYCCRCWCCYCCRCHEAHFMAIVSLLSQHRRCLIAVSPQSLLK